MERGILKVLLVLDFKSTWAQHISNSHFRLKMCAVIFICIFKNFTY